MSENFGVYIKTFKPDHYLARTLIASIRHYAPGVDITLIPDDGFTAPTLWGEKVMNTDDPFLLGLKGYYKKLWVFFGPYERFLYLDADTLALRPMGGLIDKIMNQDKAVCCVCAESKIMAALVESGEKATDAIIENTIGNPRLLEALDPSYRFRERFPFNSGFFAADRSAVSMAKLKETVDHVGEIHRECGAPPLGNSRNGVFYGDQGMINYLMYANNIQLNTLTDIFVWGGKDFSSHTEDEHNPFRNMFVHWAGCPRPNFTARNVPAGKEWIRFYREYYRTQPYSTFVKNTVANVFSDIRSRGRKRLSAIRRKLAGRSGSPTGPDR
jgi:lipopolysaccharide biosynthesis glycosyltransferase